MIVTVNGEIKAQQLGMTAPHEHIFCDYSKDYVEPPQWVKDYLRNHRLSLEKTVTLKTYGLLMREPLWSVCNQILSSCGDAREELAILKDTGVKSVIDPGGAASHAVLRQSGAVPGL